MYVLYKSKNILTLVTIGYIVGFVVGMYVEYSYGPKWPYWIYIAYIGLFGTGICRFIQVLYLGRAPRTKETLPDFREKCRVTRHSRVFRGLTGSQRTPGFWGVTAWYQSLGIRIPMELGFGYPSPLGGLIWSIGIWKPIDRNFGA